MNAQVQLPARCGNRRRKDLSQLGSNPVAPTWITERAHRRKRQCVFSFGSNYFLAVALRFKGWRLIQRVLC
jgi:hypothetical protein